MNSKQQWLLNRLLMPAGIIPPGIGLDDLVVYEQNRKQIGNIGFEYFFLIDQDAEKINSSVIGKKIYALHAPMQLLMTTPLARSRTLFSLIERHIIYKGKQIRSTPFSSFVKKTFEFSSEIGAKNITFHIGDLDMSQLTTCFKILEDHSKETKIAYSIEYEGPYLNDLLKNGISFNKVDGHYDWMLDPVLMIKEMDKITSSKPKICFDTASLFGSQIPIMETLRKIDIKRIGHVHLAGSEVGKDTASEISSEEIVEVVKYLYENKYDGSITAEVSGIASFGEFLAGGIYFLSNMLGFPLLKQQCINSAQTHVKNSCTYLLNHLV